MTLKAQWACFMPSSHLLSLKVPVLEVSRPVSDQLCLVLILVLDCDVNNSALDSVSSLMTQGLGMRPSSRSANVAYIMKINISMIL